MEVDGIGGRKEALVVESGKNDRSSLSKHQTQSWGWRMSRLMRGGTAGSGSRDQILRRERGQEKKKKKNSVRLTTSRIGNRTRVMIHSLPKVMANKK